MTSRDFVFWLQGKFEIDGKTLFFMNSEQVEMVKRHLELVFAHEPNADMPFCRWLRDVFIIAGTTQAGWDEHALELIRKRLNAVFEHIIDPSMGDAEHQAKLNSIHKPGEVKETSIDNSVKPGIGFPPMGSMEWVALQNEKPTNNNIQVRC